MANAFDERKQYAQAENVREKKKENTMKNVYIQNYIEFGLLLLLFALVFVVSRTVTLILRNKK